MSKMSSKTKTVTYYVEGPDWEQVVQVDPNAFDTLNAQIFEAATKAVEQELKTPDNFNIGALLIVKKSKKAKAEHLVNAYICLNNAAQYSLAEDLRKNFKERTGQDIAADETGISQEE